MPQLTPITAGGLTHPRLAELARGLSSLSQNSARLATTRAMEALRSNAASAIGTIALTYAYKQGADYLSEMFFSSEDDTAESADGPLSYGFYVAVVGPPIYDTCCKLYQAAKSVYRIRISREELREFYVSLNGAHHLFHAVLNSESFIAREALDQIIHPVTQELYQLPQITPCGHVVNWLRLEDDDSLCPHGECSSRLVASSLQFDWETHLRILKVVSILLIHFAEHDLGRDPVDREAFSAELQHLGRLTFTQISNIMTYSLSVDDGEDQLPFCYKWLPYRSLIAKYRLFGLD